MGFDQSNIDDLLKQAGLAGGDAGSGAQSSVDEIVSQAAGGSARSAKFESFDSGGGASSGEAQHIEQLLGDVQLKVQVVLGHSKMPIESILGLGAGSVIELDKLAGDPLDIFVNDRLVAKGEVLVLNENFCIRITDIIPPDDRT